MVSALEELGQASSVDRGKMAGTPFLAQNPTAWPSRRESDAAT
jgi:hypothetical protein